MFQRARIRLTALYVALFAVVIGLFSVVFYVGFLIVLPPAFDLAPDLTNDQVAAVAYQLTVDRIGLALVGADLAMIAVVGVAAWVLAARTLRPIDEAHARQRRFVADASHEMRTPLASILSSAEGALVTAETPTELRHALEVDVASARRLARITNDLLLLARSDELPSDRREPMDLSVVVVETVEAFAIGHPGLAPTRLSVRPDVRVLADPTEVGRIILNLVDNALRYGGGPRSSGARVTTGIVDRWAVVEVADQGPGIATEDLERIFEPFYRVRPGPDTAEGSGLGLAIARSLAERNGGRLTVVSQPSTGSTFRLSLPRFT
jgi:OmpR-family two-component system manganese-sensing sensor histidine kinase